MSEQNFDGKLLKMFLWTNDHPKLKSYDSKSTRFVLPPHEKYHKDVMQRARQLTELNRIMDKSASSV